MYSYGKKEFLIGDFVIGGTFARLIKSPITRAYCSYKLCNKLCNLCSVFPLTMRSFVRAKRADYEFIHYGRGSEKPSEARQIF